MPDREDFEGMARRYYEAEMESLRQAARLFKVADNLDDYERREQAEQRAREITGEPYGTSITRIMEVTLGGGGPAMGLEIDLDEDGEPESGRYWYQDWFKPKRYFDLNDEQLKTAWRAYNLYAEPL